MRLPAFPWPWRRTQDAAPPPAAPMPPAPPVPAALPEPGAPLLNLAAMADRDRRQALLRGVVNPTLAWLDTQGIPSDDRARVLLLAIAGQESAAHHRVQLVAGGGRGPARGLWQFEGGSLAATAGVLSHRATMTVAGRLAQARGVRAITADVWAAFERDDVLAAGFARLLLWTDAQPLPQIGDQRAAWRYYLRVWRPGAYLRPPYSLQNLPPPSARWPGHYGLAVEAVRPAEP